MNRSRDIRWPAVIGRKCGNENHVRGPFGDRVSQVQARRQRLTVDHFLEPTGFRDYFKARYGQDRQPSPETGHRRHRPA
jgi:hypothetical protein